MNERLSKEELSNSKAINLHLCSEYKQVDGLIEALLIEVINHFKCDENTKRIHKSKLKKCLTVLLLNLLSVYLADTRKYLAYSRSSSRFKKSRYQKNNIGYDIFLKAVDTLIKLGYIKSHLGFYDKGLKKGKNSRMRASSELIGLFNKHQLAGLMVQREESEEVIILKGVKIYKGKKKVKFVVDYEDTKQTIQMRENLQTINSLLDSRWVDLNVPDDIYEEIVREVEKKNRNDIDFNRKKLVRVFNNNSFEDGGRFYRGWWQEIPKEFRKHITIDGKQTVEVDYSAMHFRILYAEEGINIGNDDPYIVEGYEDQRKLIKIALNIILNAGTKETAINAIYFNNKPAISKKTAKYIYKALEDKHPNIKKYFGSGRGIKLQFKDSQIAEQVMLNLARSNIVCLPVHDSFIVRMSNQIELHEAMDKVFKDIVKVNSKRDKKATVVGSDIHLQNSKRLYGDKGHKFFDKKGNVEGVIFSGADINLDELIKLNKEYKGYHLREGEWIEHKGFI